jgi:hypothetical protein
MYQIKYQYLIPTKITYIETGTTLIIAGLILFYKVSLDK